MNTGGPTESCGIAAKLLFIHSNVDDAMQRRSYDANYDYHCDTSQPHTLRHLHLHSYRPHTPPDNDLPCSLLTLNVRTTLVLLLMSDCLLHALHAALALVPL